MTFLDFFRSVFGLFGSGGALVIAVVFFLSVSVFISL